MANGLVSIVMPSFNTGRFISQSIDSVLAQTYPNWELLIVDDCSGDDTVEVVSAYLQKDERIRFIQNEKNSGAAYTRNRALREARGEWIAFLDSDDLWLPEKLEKMLAFMAENQCVFAYHDYIKIDENSKPIGVRVTGPEVVTKRKMYCYDYPGCLTFMYSAKVMGVIQIKEIRKNNDYAILLKACKKASCHLLRENLASYRIRTHSITHGDHKHLLGNYTLKDFYDLFHICDEQPPLKAAWFTCRNLWFGFWKKKRYEYRY